MVDNMTFESKITMKLSYFEINLANNSTITTSATSNNICDHLLGVKDNDKVLQMKIFRESKPLTTCNSLQNSGIINSANDQRRAAQVLSIAISANRCSRAPPPSLSNSCVNMYLGVTCRWRLWTARYNRRSTSLDVQWLCFFE